MSSEKYKERSVKWWVRERQRRKAFRPTGPLILIVSSLTEEARRMLSLARVTNMSRAAMEDIR